MPVTAALHSRRVRLGIGTAMAASSMVGGGARMNGQYQSAAPAKLLLTEARPESPARGITG